MKETESVALYNQHFGTDLDPNEVVAAKHRYFSTRIPRLKPFASVVAVVRHFQGVLPMAVASGSVRDIVLGKLDADRRTSCLPDCPITGTLSSGIPPERGGAFFRGALAQVVEIRIAISGNTCHPFCTGSCACRARLTVRQPTMFCC